MFFYLHGFYILRNNIIVYVDCKKRRGIRVSKTSPKRSLCPKCQGWIYVGSNHSQLSCSSQNQLVDNLMVNLETKTREQLARKTISDIVGKTGDKKVSLAGLQGPKLTMSIGKIEPEGTPQLLQEEILQMQIDASLTDR